MGQRGPKPRPVRLRRRWLELFRSGSVTLAELARRAGVSLTTLYKELKRRGIDTSGYRGGQSRAREDVRWMAALYRRGLSLRLVAERIGLSQEGVRQILRRAGVEVRAPGERFPLRDPEGRPVRLKRFGPCLRALRLARGLSRAELAAKSGLHKLTVTGLEKGRQVPKWETLTRLAGALGVGLGAFGVKGTAPA